MRNIYTFQLIANCPVDNATDIYAVEIEAHREIRVETILAAIDALRTSTITQEAWTAKLAAALAAKVRLVGYHSGIRVETHSS